MRVRALAWLIVVAVIATSCGGGDSADPEAYCALIRSGVGVTASNRAVQASDLEQLLAVAPSAIRESVQELSNTTRGLTDIDEVDQLFAAAFDPDAQAARLRFNDHAVEVCGYEGEALSDDRVGSATDILSTVRGYVSDNFGGREWTTKVRYDITTTPAGALDGLTVTFILPASDDEPFEACTALSVFMYELRDAAGEVVVIDDDLVVARRAGADAACEAV